MRSDDDVKEEKVINNGDIDILFGQSMHQKASPEKKQKTSLRDL